MSNYWIDRVKAEELIIFDKTKRLIEDLQRSYKKAYKQLKSSIDDLEIRIRNNNMDLDLLEASKLITPEQRRELDKTIKNTLKGYEKLANDINYKKYKKEVKEIYKFKSLQNMGYNSRITVLKAKQMEIEAILTSLSKQQELILTKHLAEVYEDTYYKTAYINSLQKGSFENINKLDFDGVIKAVKQSWTVDGINFSKRIWKNSATISKEISKEIIVNIAIGKGVRNLSEKISKKYNVALYQASRLVQTETSAIRNRATLDRYKEEGIEKYQIIAVRDSKTSKICQSMDMKIFNTKDQVIGVNYPPFHINCRSTTKAYFEFLEEDDKTTLKEEKTLKTPEMSYKEWEKKYIIDKNEKYDIIKEKKEYKVLKDKDIKIYQKQSDEVYKKLTKEEREALSEYTQSGYDLINSELATKGQNFYEKDLNSAINKFKLKEDIITYRGTSEEYYLNTKVGDVFEGKVFYSTSLDYEQAKVFADDISSYPNEKGYKGIILEIKIPKNSKALYIGENTDYELNEKELLLSNKTKYKVIEKKDGKMILEVLNEKDY